MSRSQLLAATCLLTAIAWHVPAGAQPISGLYIGAAGGANFMQTQQLRTNPIAGLSPQYGRGSFKTGYVGLGSIGWGFGNGLRIEAEGSYRQNDYENAGGFAVGGRERKYGPMANVLFDLDIGSPYVYPYLGGGIGYQWADSSASIPVGAYSVRVNGKEGSLAYQGIAGLSFPIPPVVGLSLTAEYRYMALSGDRTVPVQVVGPGGVVAGSVKEKADFNHSLMLGLRYAFNVAPPPPPPAAAAPAAPAVAASRTYIVFFDWDRADLTPRARQVVAAAAQATTRVQVTRIEVNGYTDTSGTAAYNRGLSVRRAKSVADELVRDGVPRPAIAIEGFGETHLLVATGPGVREPQNRRVEIILH